MILAFTATVLFMAVVAALCVGALALLNVVFNPPEVNVQTAQQTAIDAVREVPVYNPVVITGTILRIPPARNFATDSVTMAAVAQ